MKYSKEIVERICELKALGDHKVVDICKQVGINPDTYYEWKKSHPDFSEALKEADNQRLEAFRDMARSGLAKLLNGHEYDEETTVYVSGVNEAGQVVPTIKERKVVKKKVMPNSTAVIFALTNQDPSNFKHVNHIDHTSKGNPVFDYSGMTTEELLARGKALKQIKEKGE